ncbi:hypothetical protein TAMA11512_21760 [Selenomonas sp. TAMA-11512]|nr:hypothetical protein TAMA11512_13130 [Selenomonas sp. TAMA-11512]BEU88712.1 hypothetical protein TAMA11512_21760 [Selenomonas sp. TAMA-11512]
MAQANPYPLRIEENIMQAIKETAKENGRSVNKEIEFVLRQYLLTQGKLK